MLRKSASAYAHAHAHVLNRADLQAQAQSSTELFPVKLLTFAVVNVASPPCPQELLTFTTAELAAIKTFGPPGLQLLGTKPLRCLAGYHQLREPYFLYPNEKDLKGSTAAFTAFLQVRRCGRFPPPLCRNLNVVYSLPAWSQRMSALCKRQQFH